MNEEQDRVDRLVRSVLAVDPSAGFESRIRQRIGNEKHTRRRGHRLLVLGSGIAAAVAVVLVLANNPHREPGRMESSSEVALPAAETTLAPAMVHNPQPMQPAPAVIKRVPAERLAAEAEGPVAQSEFPPAAPDFLVVSPLEGLSLETTPLTAVAFAPAEFPQFMIQPLSLSASN